MEFFLLILGQTILRIVNKSMCTSIYEFYIGFKLYLCIFLSGKQTKLCDSVHVLQQTRYRTLQKS